MSREYEALLRALKQDLFSADDPTDVAAQKLEAVHGHPIADDVVVEWCELSGVRCAWIDTPEAVESQCILQLCHGGAYIAGCNEGYLFYGAMLSRACAARVLLVDYRLAPAHRHPAALDDCAAAYRGLLAEGTAPQRIGLIGDSCGGGSWARPCRRWA